MLFLKSWGMKIIGAVVAAALFIFALLSYNRNQQRAGEDRIKGKVADEAGEAQVRSDKAGKEFIEKGAGEKALDERRF